MEGATLYNDLGCTEKHEMFNGESSRTKCRTNDDTGVVEKYQKGKGNNININKNNVDVLLGLPKIIIADIITCDGSIMHIVNEIMLPNYDGTP